MSAITGIFNLNRDPINIEDCIGLMNSLRRFPSNDAQTWFGESTFFGCHAQWITPESINEQLPYYDYGKQLAITADAIIDNREELFDRLQVNKHDRKTMTDSELILLAYHKWGEDSPKYLVGDFAFMIWDEKNHRLFGARDFSGSRTLYYFHNHQRFAFSTIIRPLLKLPYVGNEINEQWVAEFLAIPGIMDTIDPYSTVYRHISQLPPAHSITIVNGIPKFSRYCNLYPNQKLKLKSDDEYIEAFREVFKNAVKTHSRSYRGVGARLSGGLDSGSVVSFASRILKRENKQLYTFSYVPEHDFIDWTPKSRIADERPYIQSVVNHVGNIDDNYLDFGGKSPLSEIDSMLEMLEMPYKFFENSFWLKGIYENASHKNLGILLNGGRGNYTISWGPAIDYYAILMKKLHLFKLYKEVQQYSINKGSGRKHILKIVGERAFPILEKLNSQNTYYEFPMLISPALAQKTNVFDKLRENGIFSTSSMEVDVYKARLNLFKNVNSWSLNGTSRTKLTLKYSLWDRDPTNDLRVVKFCLSVPEEQFVKNGLDRALIRRSTESYLPDKIRLNQRIRGIQGADGIHRMKANWNSFIGEIQNIIDDSSISTFLNKNILRNALSKLKDDPKPEFTYDSEFKVLMRSLIFYRFLTYQLKGGEN